MRVFKTFSHIFFNLERLVFAFVFPKNGPVWLQSPWWRFWTIKEEPGNAAHVENKIQHFGGGRVSSPDQPQNGRLMSHTEPVQLSAL